MSALVVASKAAQPLATSIAPSRGHQIIAAAYQASAYRAKS
jgi:hypothetical protein